MLMTKWYWTKKTWDKVMKSDPSVLGLDREAAIVCAVWRISITKTRMTHASIY